VTRGPNPLTVYEGGRVESVPPIPIEVELDTCGAGDTVDAGVAAGLAGGATLYEAAEVGNIAAGVTIQKIGTTGTATPDEMLSLYDQYLLHG
jgi:sugar/nucleoside kinase (ribokinase family)